MTQVTPESTLDFLVDRMAFEYRGATENDFEPVSFFSGFADQQSAYFAPVKLCCISCYEQCIENAKLLVAAKGITMIGVAVHALMIRTVDETGKVFDVPQKHETIAYTISCKDGRRLFASQTVERGDDGIPYLSALNKIYGFNGEPAKDTNCPWMTIFEDDMSYLTKKDLADISEHIDKSKFNIDEMAVSQVDKGQGLRNLH